MVLLTLRKNFRLSIIDKYLLKKYLTSIFYSIFVFIIISVSIDYSEKTDDFANPEMTFQEALDYFFSFIPSIVSLLLPIFVFISTIFFTSKLAAKTEFIPMFSSGMNMAKILKPYFLGSLIIAAIAWYANFDFLPTKNRIKADFLTKYVDGKHYNNIFIDYAIKIDSNITLEIKRYEPDLKTGTQVSLYETDHLALKKIIRADSLIWDTIQKKWTIINLSIRTFKNNHEILTTEKKEILKTFITPADFNHDIYLKEKLSKKELKEKILQEEIKGSSQINTYKLELYKRDATPFSIIVLTLIAAIISSKKIRGGSGIHLAIGLLISALYVALDRFSSVFSTNSDLSPLLASWLPNIIFSLVTIYLYSKSQQ